MEVYAKAVCTSASDASGNGMNVVNVVNVVNMWKSATFTLNLMKINGQ